ncbi:hypothetical protein KKA14_01635, partial [bacterium]|nr:hypothetical protein [bacterium]
PQKMRLLLNMKYLLFYLPYLDLKCKMYHILNLELNRKCPSVNRFSFSSSSRRRGSFYQFKGTPAVAEVACMVRLNGIAPLRE